MATKELRGFLKAFHSAGWLSLPLQRDASIEEVLDGCGLPDLIQWLNTYWRDQLRTDPASQRSRKWERLSEWGSIQESIGAKLTDGANGFEAFKQFEFVPRLADRLVYWAAGLPPISQPTAGIVSSRTGRRLVERVEWFDYLRAACKTMQAQSRWLITAEGTAGSRFIRTAGEIYGLTTLSLRVPKKKQDVGHWLRRLLTCQSSRAHFAYEAWLSPSLVPSADEESARVPLRDQLVSDLGDELFVVHVRPGGNIERLVRARLLAPNGTRTTFIAQDASMIPRGLAEEFIGCGAVAWKTNIHGDGSSCNIVPITPNQSLNREAPPPTAARVLTSAQFDRWSFLTHCTRSIFGPWPGQTEATFLRELLTSRDHAPRTAFASLTRIVRQQKLWASGQGIRGRSAVICFSELPLPTLLSMRSFKAHRGRWDFEPYGICIDREWLIARGARPVFYGEERAWEEVPGEDRPFFQRRSSSGRGGRRIYDWTTEREWRVLGDLDLGGLCADSAMLFVPSESEAHALATESPWPVLVAHPSIELQR